MRTLLGMVLVWCLMSAASEACTCRWGRTRSLSRPAAHCAAEPRARCGAESSAEATAVRAPQPNMPMVTAGLALGLGSALGLVALFRKSL